MEEDASPLLMDINASIQALCIIYFLFLIDLVINVQIIKILIHA